MKKCLSVLKSCLVTKTLPNKEILASLETLTSMETLNEVEISSLTFTLSNIICFQ